MKGAWMFDQSHNGLPLLAGVGYKPQHFKDILENPVPVSWLEIHAENYTVDGGRPLAQLRHLAERFPISVHGVGLSIGGEAALDAAFAELTGQARGAPTALALLGREIEVPETARGVARFDFNQLCGKPLGPADYLAIAEAFHTLVLDNIPRLGPENFDKARRFITCIDTLYEHRCKLVASAASSPDQLYERGTNADDGGNVAL
jgi:predicted ATPase